MEGHDQDVEEIRRLLGQMHEVPVPASIDQRVRAMGCLMVRRRRVKEPGTAAIVWPVVGVLILVLIGAFSILIPYLSSIRLIVASYHSSAWLFLTSYVSSLSRANLVLYGAV